ncbi:MAG: transcriptional regulator [Beijerinckiaceae bacterium]
MQTYSKKRIEIIVEAPLVRRLTERLQRPEVHGYSVLPVVAGSGHAGAWSSEGQVSDAGRMMAIVSVVDPAVVDAVVDDIFSILSRQIGFVAISDVSVIRRDMF